MSSDRKSLQLPPDHSEPFFGARIQRTMTLLSTSTAAHPHTVRILCYGQSITGQPYMNDLFEKKLPARFPQARIVFENRSIGGYEAPKLIRTAVHDIFPFDPDLMVFHAYGGQDQGELERIIADIKRLTTAEIVLFNHHLDNCVENDRSIDPLRVEHSEHIRMLACKYNCEFVDVRAHWTRYLADNGLQRADLLNDCIHLNTHGGELLTSLILRHFKATTIFPSGWMNTARTYFPQDLVDKDGSITLAFTGNRVALFSMADASSGRAKILIDGKPPSSFPCAYACTRPTSTPLCWFLGVNRIALGPDPREEEWQLTFTRVNDKGDEFAFSVHGSITGPDGEGSSAGIFVSRSGRIGIDPVDIDLIAPQLISGKHFSTPFTVSWKVWLRGVDIWSSKSSSAELGATTVIAGIENAQHTLEIVPVGKGPVPVGKIVVYRPGFF